MTSKTWRREAGLELDEGFDGVTGEWNMSEGVLREKEAGGRGYWEC